MLEHKDMVKCVAFSANDEIIVTGSYDNSIIRWSAATGEQIGEPLLHNAPVECLSMSADGTVIVSCTFRTELFLWNAINGQTIGESVLKECFGRLIPTRNCILTNNGCTKIVTWTCDEPLTWWTAGPTGAIRKIHTLHLPVDVTACPIEATVGVIAVGLENGAVAVCDIHE